MIKKLLIVIFFVIIILSNFVFAEDSVDRRGKTFFASNASVDSYIYAVKNAPDSEVRRYAIRQLGKTNDPKAVPSLTWALRFGVDNIDSHGGIGVEGDFKIRQEAASALSHFTVEIPTVILVLKRAMNDDPNDGVQAQSAIALGKIGGQSPENIKLQILEFLKFKVSKTEIHKIEMNIALVRAFGYNKHNSARTFLMIMRSRGYTNSIKRHIDFVLQTLR